MPKASSRTVSRQGKGWFEQRLGPDVEIQWFTYNAGPSAMEAIFAGSLDLTYVGQGPALNAHFKSEGEEIRVISGAANGGAALVVRPDEQIKTRGGFSREDDRHAAARQHPGYLLPRLAEGAGFQSHADRRRRQVLPTANPDQLSLFQQKQVDAVWTVEPWVTRLEREGERQSLSRRQRRAYDLAGHEREIPQGTPRSREENRGRQRRADAWIQSPPRGSAKGAGARN